MPTTILLYLWEVRLDEINRLKQLRVFKMDHNGLAGSIPFLGDLADSLEYLNFYENALTGKVPKDIFGRFTNLGKNLYYFVRALLDCEKTIFLVCNMLILFLFFFAYSTCCTAPLKWSYSWITTN